MKNRTLLALVLALTVAGLAAWLARRDGRGTSAPAPLGAAALRLQDENAISRIEVISGTQVVDLVRAEAGWVVRNLWDHPADFDQIVRLLRDLTDMKVGEVIRGGTGMLAEFGLETSGANETAQVPVEIRLLGGDASALASAVLGSPRVSRGGDSMMPDSQYVRIDEGPVLVVDRHVQGVSRRPEDWLNREILDIAGSSVDCVAVRFADGRTYGVERDPTWAGRGELDGQRINEQGADLGARSLENLSTVTIIDPASDRSALGLGTPDTVDVRTRDGLTVRVELGTPTAESLRPAVIHASFSPAPVPDSSDTNVVADVERRNASAAAATAALNAKASPWIYMLSGSAAQQLTLLKDQLIAGPPAQPTAD